MKAMPDSQEAVTPTEQEADLAHALEALGRHQVLTAVSVEVAHGDGHRLQVLGGGAHGGEMTRAVAEQYAGEAVEVVGHDRREVRVAVALNSPTAMS